MQTAHASSFLGSMNRSVCDLRNKARMRQWRCCCWSCLPDVEEHETELERLLSPRNLSHESVLSDLSLEELFRKQYIPHEGYKRVRFQNIDDGKYVCIEMLNVTSEQESNVWLTQVPMVSALRHDNLAQVLGYRVEGSTQVLAYESTMASLHDVLHGRKESAETLDWMQRVRIVVDAAKGLKYLHENDTLHGDIGSNIVFLSADLKPKIAYYYFFNHAGYLVRKIRQTRQDSINPGYYAPEILKSASGLSESSDVYSFGVLILELLSGTDPLDESMRMDYVRWATPKLSVGTVELLVDGKLKGKYPLKAVEKLASVAALCLQERDLFRPNMSIVVRELQSLLEPL